MRQPTEPAYQPQSADEWARLDALLAEALELELPERERWLQDLAQNDPAVANRLRSLLGYLEHDTLLPDENPQRLREQVALGLLEARPGSRFGAWTVVRPLGMGGMSEVYLARRELEQGVQLAALKLISASLSHTDAHARLARETAVLSQLNDPRIARLIDSGRSPQGRPWFAMEFVQGQALDEGCDARSLSIRERVALIVEVARAVEHAHRQLVVHRDIKPANVLLDAESGAVKLLDFGIAKILAPTDQPNTATRAFTPAHASPEQLAGRHVTTASDVFQLGALLYLLITGTRPFGEGDSDLGLQLAQMEHGVEKPSQRVRHTAPERLPRCASDTSRLSQILRGDLDTIALKALDFETQRRYLSARELADDLQRWLDADPISARPDLGYRLARRLRKHWIAVAATLLSLALLFAHLISLNAQKGALQAERQRTQRVLDTLTEMFSAADPLAVDANTITVAEVVRRTSDNMLTARDQDPEFQVLMLERLATLSSSARAYATQQALLRRAAEIADDAGLEPALRARIRLALAEALFGAGELLASREQLERARPDLDAFEGLSARLLDGKLSIEMGEKERARLLFSELIPELPVGDAHAVLRAQTHNSYGILLRHSGDADGAIEQYRIALTEMPTDRPAHYDQILTTRSNLAIALGVQRRYAESEREFRELLDWTIDTLGPGHATVPTLARNFSTLLVHTLRFESAWALLSAHKATARRSSQQLQHASFLEGLSMAALYSGHHAQAIDAATEAVALRIELLGPSAPALRGSLNHLAWTLFELGANAEAMRAAQIVAPRAGEGFMTSRLLLVLSAGMGLEVGDTAQHRSAIEADDCFGPQLLAMEAALARSLPDSLAEFAAQCDGGPAARMIQLGAPWRSDSAYTIAAERWSSPLVERLMNPSSTEPNPLRGDAAERLRALLDQLEEARSNPAPGA